MKQIELNPQQVHFLEDTLRAKIEEKNLDRTTQKIIIDLLEKLTRE